MLLKNSLIIALLFLSASSAIAAGMKPQVPVLFIDDENREATITVENTDSSPALLHSSLQTIPEDRENKLILTPQLARVEAGDKQQVRVVLKEGITLTTQTMQRINFTPVPTDDGKKNRARVTIGQNIPVILSPASLPLNTTPWQGLTAQRAGTSLFINNPTPYIVRLTTQIDLLPGKTRVELPKTYILPHESITIALPQGASHAQSLRLHPVTRFGILTAPYELRL